MEPEEKKLMDKIAQARLNHLELQRELEILGKMIDQLEEIVMGDGDTPTDE